MSIVCETMSIKECMVCHHFNRADATACEECLLPLYSGDDTLHSREPFDYPAYAESAYITLELHEERVILFGDNHRQRLDFADHIEMILGREDEAEFSPTLNLAPYNGHVLGVSRHHAAITYNNGAFWIMDLESRYGTRINDQLLNPQEPCELHNGDTVRLGELQMKVQFSRRTIATY